LKPQKKIDLDTEYLKTLTGVYNLNFESSVTTTIDIFNNKLRALTPDNEYVELKAITKIKFKGDSSYGPISLYFNKNTKGEYTEVVIYSGFSKFIFEKHHNN
jgi:hypothetical protein